MGKIARTTAFICLTLGPTALFIHAGEALDDATKERIAKFEAGPATIDTSSYPEPIQERYRVFSDRCSQCHTLARPINSSYTLPQEWSRYVKRMMRKPGSGINPKKAKQIYEFLVYDAVTRRKAVLDKKLATVSAGEKAEAEAKIQEVLDAYGVK